MPTIVVTRVTGQDGAYLTELMLARGYEVYGTYRRSNSTNFWRLQEVGVLDHPNLRLIEYDLTDSGAAMRLLDRAKPEHVFNLAAQRLIQRGPVEMTTNIATGQATSLTDIIKTLEALTGHKLGIVRDERFVRPDDPKFVAGEVSLLESLIGPVPRTPRPELLSEMLDAT